MSITDLPVVLWWTPLMKSFNHIRECYFRRCVFTDDRQLFSLTDVPKVSEIHASSHRFDK